MKKARWPESQREIMALTPEDHATRTQTAMNWINTTGKEIGAFPQYGAMVPREVSVAIGWEDWPVEWPRS